MTDLANRNILVTGAGDGIGRAVALQCASAGAQVILLGRTQKKLEAVYDEIVAAGGHEPLLMPLDLRTATDTNYQAIAEAIEDQLEILHGLVHCAGMLGPIRPVDHLSAAELSEALQLNVLAAFALTRALLPCLRAAPTASVIFSTSNMGIRGRAYWGAYSVSKFAVEGLAQVFADELANTSKVRVNLINPGATRTTMRAQAYPNEDPQQLKTPTARAPLYIWLLSDAAATHHGQRFDADNFQPTSG